MKPSLPAPPFLYPVLDLGLLGERSVGGAVAALLRGGARVLQLRAKAVSDRLLLEAAREAREATRLDGALLLINDRPDVALIVGADGVHVGQDDLTPAEVRAVLGLDAIVGLSTHNATELQRAVREPVDYVAVGPVFATSTKAQADPVVGLDFVRWARSQVSRPLVAIGGIHRGNARDVVNAGADGLAVASALLAGEDATASARALCAALRGAS